MTAMHALLSAVNIAPIIFGYTGGLILGLIALHTYRDIVREHNKEKQETKKNN